MGIAGNLYTGSAAWGKVQGIGSLVCCTLCAFVIGGIAVVRVMQDEKAAAAPPKSKGVMVSAICAVMACMISSGVCFFYATQKSKGFAALAGVADLSGMY